MVDLSTTKSYLYRFQGVIYGVHEHPISFSFSKITFLFVFYLYITGVRRSKLPPGPRGLPVVGNLFQFSREVWLSFGKWKEDYGPITYLSLAGQGVVILHTHKAAADLMDRRASVYSGRPRNIVAAEILARGLLFPFATYDDKWRRMRRAAHEGLNKSAATKYHNIQEIEALVLTHGLLQEPDAMDLHFRRTAASSILSIVYDKPPLKSLQDPTIRYINEFVERLSRTTYPGNYLVEFFPWMKHIPSSIAKWKREAESWYAKDSAEFGRLYDDVEKRMKNDGDDRPSFCASLVSGKDRYDLKTMEGPYLAGIMFAGGADTSSASLAWFAHTMILCPEIQKKAQEEIENVVGRSRMPAFTDYDRLPYIRALIKELLRFRPVTPIGLPHSVTQDDWYEGYFIPAGTICIGNVWGMNRDPTVYGPDADVFNPARHLDKDGKLAPAPPDTKEESHVTFGFGKRICVGRYIANNSLFINVATILWALDIGPAKDSNGQPIIPDQGDKCLTDGTLARPFPFQCTFTPRFSEAEGLLTQTLELHGIQV